MEQAQKCRRADCVLVATDDNRIFDAVRSFGGHAVMTSDSHQSGTDRIAEVIRRPEFASVETIVNIQGDEPDIDPDLVDLLIGVISRGSEIEIPMATASTPFFHPRDIENPNHVKVVTDRHHCALYFSRAVIPFDRDRAGLSPQAGSTVYQKHLGIYAYRREALLKLSSTPPANIERLEKLEQLRALYLGMKIFVQETAHGAHGVDTPEDYAAFVKRYNEAAARHTENDSAHRETAQRALNL